MKKTLLGLLLVAVLAVPTGYFGKQYFENHYVLLNEQDMAELTMAISMTNQMAYEVGRMSCNKTL